MLSIGDMVRVHFDGKGSSGEILEGLVLDVFFVDGVAKRRRDNNARWIAASMLIDGRPRFVHLYWDDEYEILS